MIRLNFGQFSPCRSFARFITFEVERSSLNSRLDKYVMDKFPKVDIFAFMYLCEHRLLIP